MICKTLLEWVLTQIKATVQDYKETLAKLVAKLEPEVIQMVRCNLVSTSQARMVSDVDRALTKQIYQVKGYPELTI